jgi:hypothetical protein
MIKIIILFFTFEFIYAQDVINSAGGNIKSTEGEISYSIGQVFQTIQIPKEVDVSEVKEEVTLSVPSFEVENSKPIIKKKKSFIENLFDIIISIFKRKK